MAVFFGGVLLLGPIVLLLLFLSEVAIVGEATEGTVEVTDSATGGESLSRWRG